MGLFSQLKSFDVYPKLHDEFQIKTFHGGLVSLISLMTIVVLFISELSFYLSTDLIDTLYVDVNRNEKLNINFNITFPHIPCQLLSLDAMDLSGNHQLGVHATITKQPLDEYGKEIQGTAEQQNVLDNSSKDKSSSSNDISDDDFNTYKEAAHVTDDTMTKQKLLAKIAASDYCGSCYGAGKIENQCCNTCDAVKAAYRERGWSLPRLASVEQCVAAGSIYDEGERELQQHQGCKIYGYLQVAKVAGNFHFSPGRTFELQSMHFHDLAPFNNQGGKFNISHKIDLLSFGLPYPGIVNPLDNTVNYITAEGEDPSGMFMYYAKVVPTSYSYLSGQVIQSNQFSVTEHYRPLTQSSNGLPGVFVFYELSPIMVAFEEKRRSFFHFCTQLCAILGGVWTVANMIDRLVYAGVNAAQKQRVGKLI